VTTIDLSQPMQTVSLAPGDSELIVDVQSSGVTPFDWTLAEGNGAVVLDRQVLAAPGGAVGSGPLIRFRLRLPGTATGLHMSFELRPVWGGEPAEIRRLTVER
jgi:predicted secreted protein